eukprot:20493_2
MNIIFTFYQLVGPLQGLFRVGQVFKGLEDTAKELGVDLLLQKLVYIAAQLAVLLYITNRFGNMGLLPTSAGDWLSGIRVKNPNEFSMGGFPLCLVMMHLWILVMYSCASATYSVCALALFKPPSHLQGRRVSWFGGVGTVQKRHSP